MWNDLLDAFMDAEQQYWFFRCFR